MPHARILIRPKPGILDPQGVAVQEALPRLGFSGVRDVRVGRLVELDVDDPGQLDAMCERLLANPLVEDVEVLVGDGAPDAATAARAAAAGTPPADPTTAAAPERDEPTPDATS